MGKKGSGEKTRQSFEEVEVVSVEVKKNVVLSLSCPMFRFA
jgi:hypothetical protein